MSDDHFLMTLLMFLRPMYGQHTKYIQSLRGNDVTNLHHDGLPRRIIFLTAHGAADETALRAPILIPSFTFTLNILHLLFYSSSVPSSGLVEEYEKGGQNEHQIYGTQQYNTKSNTRRSRIESISRQRLIPIAHISLCRIAIRQRPPRKFILCQPYETIVHWRQVL